MAQGHGWAGSSLFGPTHTAGSCHARPGPLPDPACTPGATDSAVTQATIDQTICVRGYTAGVRPPQSVTGPAKQHSLSEYSTSGTAEYDHLIPLDLGGASDTRNLWPQPGSIPNAKDSVENDLRKVVCAHKMPLAVAQQKIATNWQTALN